MTTTNADLTIALVDIGTPLANIIRKANQRRVKEFWNSVEKGEIENPCDES